MRLGRILLHRFYSLLRRSRAEADLEREIEIHLEQLTREYRESGLSETEARLRARREFGPVEATKEDCRDRRRVRVLDEMFRDVTYAIRLFRKSPIFAASAVLILALSIGANTALFSLMNAVMLRTLPVRAPEQLVELVRLPAGQERARSSFPWYNFLRQQSHSFTGISAQFEPSQQAIDVGGAPELVETQMVSGSYYEILGVKTVLGRTFTPADDSKAGTSPFAVISYHYWQHRFALSPTVIGRTVKLNGTVFAIVGVTPPGFSGTAPGHDPDVTFPLSMCAQVRKVRDWLTDSGINWLDVIGRLKPDVSLAQAQAETRVLFEEWKRGQAAQQKDPRDQKLTLAEMLLLEPAPTGLNALRLRFAQPLVIGICMVGLLLLLACVNLSSLLLGRTFSRAREVSIRMAVGAGRHRLIRQFLIESSLLTLAGGAFGLWLAQVLCHSLVVLLANGGELFLPVPADERVLGFTAFVSMAASLVTGLAPALYGTRVDIHEGLARQEKQMTVANALLTVQVALSLVLLIGATLFVRTVVNLKTLHAGFDPTGVLLFQIHSDQQTLQGKRRLVLQRTIVEHLRTIPGVTSASEGLVVSLSGNRVDGDVDVEGYEVKPGENNRAYFNLVGPSFFHTVRTELLLGREFQEWDTPASPPVAVVNQAFARHYFGSKSPIGRRVNGATIIGLVENAKYLDLRQAFPETVYFAASQDTTPEPITYLVRVGTGEPQAVLESVRRIVRTINPQWHVVEATSMAHLFDASILKERILALLSSCFGSTPCC
jgi:predicted permease